MMERTRWGAQARADDTGALPTAFPRSIGPNAERYLREVVESGLTCDMMGRFEQAFAEALGVKHCIATPGGTPAPAVLAAALTCLQDKAAGVNICLWLERPVS